MLFVLLMMGNLWGPISREPRALTKADKHIHSKTHMPHTHRHTHTYTHMHAHIHTHTPHTYTHRKNTSLVVMGLMETEERE